ncbi:MAG: AAA family ATPase [Clostridia bacterium]|nr:AAA family ATPase [Clostridia bacterium]
MKNRIIFLTGLTSAGKTSVARAIQEIEPDYMLLSNDIFEHMLSDRARQENYFASLSRAIVLMYESAEFFLARGKKLIIDGMLLDLTEFHSECGRSHIELLDRIIPKEHRLLVELVCPLEECRRRNIARGNRGEFQSAWQAEHMASFLPDLQLESDRLSSAEMAEQILTCINNIT